MDLSGILSRVRGIVTKVDDGVSALTAQREKRDPDSGSDREVRLMRTLDLAEEALPKLEDLINALDTYRDSSSSSAGK